MKLTHLLSTMVVLLSSSVCLAQEPLKQIATGSTPLYNYHDVKLQDLSGSAYINGHVFLMSDGGKNSEFPEVRVTSKDALDSPAHVFQRQIIQRDIEGATQIGNTVYISSSLSQVSEDTGDYRVLSSIQLDDKAQIVSEKYVYARKMVLSVMEETFGDNAWLRRVKVSFGKSGGINVEGLSTSHNKGDSLVFGFRSPLVDKNFGSPLLDPDFSLKQGLAILMEVEDPLKNKLPKSSITLIDLDGQGIRGVEYIPAMNGYVIISGGVEKLNEYHLWFYNPILKQTVKLSKTNDDFSKLCRPESVLNIPESSTLMILSEESGKACSNVKFNYITYKY